MIAHTNTRREQLILEHMWLVNLVARRIHRGVPRSVCLDDLASSGVIGLINAVDKYNHDHPVKLKTYAEFKIRGAILDSLRDMDWVSHHRRARYKQIEAAVTSAEKKLNRRPTEEEIALELTLTLEGYHALLIEVQGINLKRLATTAIPSRDELPSDAAERADYIAKAMNLLAKYQRRILKLFYEKEQTLEEIAASLNVSAATVSRLKAISINALRRVAA